MSLKTIEEFVEHLKNPTTACLVCDNPIRGIWTDLNGEIRCDTCGTPYQIINHKLNDEWMQSQGLTDADIVMPYCNQFEMVDLLCDYWRETRHKMPFGSYLGMPPDDVWLVYNPFFTWLAQHADKYQEEYADYFDWDAIKSHYASKDTP